MAVNYAYMSERYFILLIIRNVITNCNYFKIIIMCCVYSLSDTIVFACMEGIINNNGHIALCFKS